MKKFIASVLILVLLSSSSYAATNTFRRQLATVVICGIGGAVLGLSTLSFYGQPQDHLSNVYTGFLLGLAGGGAYLAYNSSIKNNDSYYSKQDFERHVLADLNTRSLRPQGLEPKFFKLEYNF